VYLIAGLGNPGAEVQEPRHNIGSAIVHAWAKSLGVGLSGRRFQSRYGPSRVARSKPRFALPSHVYEPERQSPEGKRRFFSLRTERILVVHDDIDLPLGRIKVIRKGGAGGHKGLLSIFDHLARGNSIV